MTIDRIKEIQEETAYPNSQSVQQALMKVWNECKQEQLEKTEQLSDRIKEMEEAGKEATSLIAHLKDQHGFNEVEEESQDKIMKVFKYEGRW